MSGDKRHSRTCGEIGYCNGCTPTPVPSEVAETTAGEREVDIVQRIVNAWNCCGTCAGGVLAAHDRATADRVRREEGERIARQSERLRTENPMNGDGSNHMLDRVQKVIDSPDAIADERRIISAEREARYAQLEAENAARAASVGRGEGP